MRERWKTALTWGLPILLVLPFVLNLDAQWMRLDDFSMVEGFSPRRSSMASLVLDIVFTRNTPHVRFAFLNHLVLLPLFRWAPESRQLVNLYFLAAPVLVVAAIAALMRRQQGGLLLLAAGWATLATELWTSNVWQTFEFKLALYLVFGFVLTSLAGLLLGTVATRGGELTAPQGLKWAFIVVSLAGIHMAEVTMAGLAIIGAALVWRRQMPWWALAVALGWPLFWWALNALLFPRPVVVLQQTAASKTLLAALEFAVQVLFENWALGVSVLLAWTLVSGIRFLRQRPRTVSVSGTLALAFFAQAVAVILLTSLSYRWVGERHLALAGLSIAAAVIFAAYNLTQDLLPPRLAFLPAAALLVMFALRLPATGERLFGTIDGRRAELKAVQLLTAQVQDAAAHIHDRTLNVFVEGWDHHSGRYWVAPTFLEADWSREAYARTFACPRSGTCPKIHFYVGGARQIPETELPSFCKAMEGETALWVPQLHNQRLGEIIRFESQDHCRAFLARGAFSVEKG